MHKWHSSRGAAFLYVGFGMLTTALNPTGLHAADDVLKITVGKPTQLSEEVYQNTSSVMVSRTGVVAAFYPKAGTGPKFYRVSADRGYTWSPEMDGPAQLNGGADCGTLRDGGVIMPVGETRPAADGTAGWYEKDFLRFSDDMMGWEVETARMYIPEAGSVALDHVAFPTLAKGKMVQLPNGDVLAPAYSMFNGDSSRRVRAPGGQRPPDGEDRRPGILRV